jgi:hypothetical protein
VSQRDGNHRGEAEGRHWSANAALGFANPTSSGQFHQRHSRPPAGGAPSWRAAFVWRGALGDDALKVLRGIQPPEVPGFLEWRGVVVDLGPDG